MSRFSPLDFQKKTIEEITEAFKKLWEKDQNQRPLILKSPTASGKTLMVSNFIHGLNTLPNWDYDKAFIWITFSDTLAMQSKDKFKKYLNTNLENNLLTVEDFKQGKLFKNEILFINWQKLVSKSSENRILRRPDDPNFRKEQGFYFEDIIENTRKEGREIIMVIDESHTHLSDLAQTRVIDIVNPKIVLHVSATPKKGQLSAEDLVEGNGAMVVVKREEVVKEGLIKEKIAVQTDEDLHKYPGRDLDELLIDLAIEKKSKLEREYEMLGKNINPLVLIQLPNDDSKRKDAGHKTKEEIVLNYLAKKNVEVEHKVALWFDGKQKNMEFIEENENEVDFMLFKQAAGTGWDCPRAHILIMFREISSATFHTQTIGRILRTAEPEKKEDYKNSPSLKTAYLYTNYKRNEIGVPDQSNDNKPYIYTSLRKEGINNVENLYSDFVYRVDYGDLGNAFHFQRSFLNSMNNFFGIEENEHLQLTRIKLSEKGIDLEPHLTNKLVVDAEISDYDKLNLEFATKGREEEYEMSRNDVEKLFNYLCFKILSEQTEKEARITNVSRSWSPLKSALRVWLKRVVDINSDYYYRVFIQEINKDQSSIFRLAITKALKEYYPIKKEYLEKRKKQSEEKEAPLFEIQEEYKYTEDFAKLREEEGSSLLSAIQPFYLRKEYKGRENELKFIQYLEQKEDSLEWWFKNGEGSKEFYCLKYFNSSTNQESLFYPDWILRFKDGRIGILDTKSGFTAQNPEGRAEGLANKIEELNSSKEVFMGGLVVLENSQWYLSDSKEYSYSPGDLGENWKELEIFF